MCHPLASSPCRASSSLPLPPPSSEWSNGTNWDPRHRHFTHTKRKPVVHGRATGIMIRASKARRLLKWGGRRRFIRLRGPGCSRVLPYLPNVIHSFALMFLPPSAGPQGEPGEQSDHGRRVGGQGRDRQCNKNFTDRHIALLSKGAARARTLLARAGHSSAPSALDVEYDTVGIGTLAPVLTRHGHMG